MSNIMSNIIGWTFDLLDENSYYPLLMPICDVEKYKDNLKKMLQGDFGSVSLPEVKLPH